MDIIQAFKSKHKNYWQTQKYKNKNIYPFRLKRALRVPFAEFFRCVHNKQIEVQKIERPHREHRLPRVLSKEEVVRLLTRTDNIKHRVMLSLVYACGLRKGELLGLKPSDIESSRGIILVRQGKGRKDRIVPVSERKINMLRDYYKAFRPKTWLFEGQTPGEPYSSRSIQQV